MTHSIHDVLKALEVGPQDPGPASAKAFRRRVLRAVAETRITTVAELLSTDGMVRMMRARGFGPFSLMKLRAALHRLGLSTAWEDLRVLSLPSRRPHIQQMSI